MGSALQCLDQASGRVGIDRTLGRRFPGKRPHDGSRRRVPEDSLVGFSGSVAGTGCVDRVGLVDGGALQAYSARRLFACCPPIGVGRVLDEVTVVVGVVVPPGWASFAEGDFGGVNFFASCSDCGFVAGSFGGGNFSACGHQLVHQTLTRFFVETWVRATPQAFFVNEVAAIGCGGVFQNAAGLCLSFLAFWWPAYSGRLI